MTFTDENLQQLKRELNQRVENIAVWAPCLQALIYRLEVAEKACEAAEIAWETHTGGARGRTDWLKLLDNTTDAWRKAAGK